MSTTPMLAPTPFGREPEQITAIEYHRYRSGWKPFTVLAGCDHYNFDWCEQDKLLAYHQSGFDGNIRQVFSLARFVDAPKLCAKLWYDHGKRTPAQA